MKRILALLLCAATLLLSVGCAADQSGDPAETTGSGTTAPIPTEPAVTSETYALSRAVFLYFLNSEYMSFLQQYGDYLSYINLDTEKKLKDQMYSDNERTWFGYFVDQTELVLEQYIVLAEAAKAEGMELSQDTRAEMDAQIEQFRKYATEDGYESFDAYIAHYYGEGVNEAAMREALELNLLAVEYYNTIYDRLTVEDAEYDALYEKYGKVRVDYASYTIKSAKDEDGKAAAQAAQTRLEGCDSLDAFLAAVKELVVADGYEKDDLDAYVESHFAEGAEKGDVTGNADWLFSEDRAAGDTTSVIDTKGNTTVYFLVKPVHRSEYPSRAFRHVLITTSTAGSAEKAKTQAQAILDEYLAGEQTPEAFGKLAEKYSEDTASVPDGGLYTDVFKGQMVEPIETWCYDASRKVGDVGLAETTYGCHVVYYCGEGITAWKAEMKDAVLTQKFNDQFKTLSEKFPVSFDAEVIESVDM